MTPIPLHPETRRWLARLQRTRGRYFLAAGLTPEAAAEEATVFVEALAAMGIDMGPNVISRALGAGATFREAMERVGE